jgi:GNAT superfamily N-acetyltransferase
MTHLNPMSETAFAAWLHVLHSNWVDTALKSGSWPADVVEERVRVGIATLLPQGVDTPYNSLFEIVAQPDNRPVGSLWVNYRELSGQPALWVCDISILPHAQRQGHGKRAFSIMETMAREAGITAIGLNVFTHNHGAQRLYKSLGFQATNTHMVRSLAMPEQPQRSPVAALA